MAGWKPYLDQIITSDDDKDSPITEAAIFSQDLQLCAATDGLKDIQPADLAVLNSDRSGLPATGMKIGKDKCIFLNDALDTDGQCVLNMKSKPSDGSQACPTCISKTRTLYLIAKGSPSASGGQVSNKLYKTNEWLRKLDY